MELTLLSTWTVKKKKRRKSGMTWKKVNREDFMQMKITPILKKCTTTQLLAQ